MKPGLPLHRTPGSAAPSSATRIRTPQWFGFWGFGVQGLGFRVFIGLIGVIGVWVLGFSGLGFLGFIGVKGL